MIMLRKHYESKTQLFPHQKEAVLFILNNKDVAIFDEQGLGKTKVVIDSLSKEMELKRINSVLIICKKNLMNNWKEEIEIHSNLSSVIVRESKVKRGNLLTFPVSFMIISYETATNEIDALIQLLKIRKFAVVLDESHRIKNPYSKATKAIHELSPFAKQKIILSGTPVANKPEDLWAQFYFLDEGKLLSADFHEFKVKFQLKNNKIDVTSLSRLREIVNKKSIRRLKKDVLELPDKRYINIEVPLNKEQRKIYDQLKEEMIVEITDMNDKQINEDIENILKKLLRLTQIASNPQLINKKYTEEPAKFGALDKAIKNIIKRGEKTIVWSSFIENILKLKKRYSNYNPVVIYGGMSIDRRNESVTEFKTNPACKILIANPAAAREGLTLTIANNAIYLDRNFNLVDYLQSQDRIHRISQTRKCNIMLILAKDSIDEYIDAVLFKKMNIAKFIEGDIKSIKEETLTKQDIMTLLEG